MWNTSDNTPWDPPNPPMIWLTDPPPLVKPFVWVRMVPAPTPAGGTDQAPADNFALLQIALKALDAIVDGAGDNRNVAMNALKAIEAGRANVEGKAKKAPAGVREVLELAKAMGYDVSPPAVQATNTSNPAPVLPERPMGFDAWWDGFRKWQGGWRFPAKDEPEHKITAYAAWQAAQSPITPTERLAWTRETPKVPGWYFRRVNQNASPIQWEVFWCEPDRGFFSPYADDYEAFPKGFEWAGPIPEPISPNRPNQESK
jgi:hypothetical protein